MKFIFGFWKTLFWDWFTFYGGGAGGGTTYTQGTTQTSNIPEYARPYVESMLGAAQKQIFTMKDGNITGMKPYTPYSTNAEDYVAGFSPLQQQAQTGVANLRLPAQYGQASAATGGLGLQAATAGQQYEQAATNPGTVGAYMNPYVQQSLAPQLQQLAQQTGIRSAQEQAAATSAGAFGGSRQALASALNKQAGNLAAQQAIGQGYNQAYDQAQRAMQYGAGLNLQGLQTALGAAGQLADIGGKGLQAQEQIYGLQSKAGAEQQALQQQRMDQMIQNYATAQQWPMQQLANMSALLHGLPLQNTSTAEYKAPPSAMSQLGGAGIAGISLYNAMK